jgi:hypothetical protein
MARTEVCGYEVLSESPRFNFLLANTYFAWQSARMESNWAAEHLQVIRTLMERSTVYRRALAPIMIVTGVIGILAALLAVVAGVGTDRAFVLFWMAVGLGAVFAAFLLARRQALKDAEPFWSPPTRRVAQALSPPLIVGLLLGVWAALAGWGDVGVLVLPVWMMLYGCAIHAAGFFMPRGMKLFGWGMIAAGALVLGLQDPVARLVSLRCAVHGAMGLGFGLLHLAYGIYLYFTEQRNKAA